MQWMKTLGSLAHIIVVRVAIHPVQDVIRKERRWKVNSCLRNGSARSAWQPKQCSMCNVQAVLGSYDSKGDLLWSARKYIWKQKLDRFACLERHSALLRRLTNKADTQFWPFEHLLCRPRNPVRRSTLDWNSWSTFYSCLISSPQRSCYSITTFHLVGKGWF